MISGPRTRSQKLDPAIASGRLCSARSPQRSSSLSEPRSYARVAPVRSTSSWKESATATTRWTREETRARVTAGPEFGHPSPDRSQLDDLVAGYEQITSDPVRRPAKRNLIAACYRVHGDDLLPLVREWFEHTGTVTNLLGELRVLPPRAGGPVPASAPGSTKVMEPDSPTPGDGSRRQRGASRIGGQVGPDQRN